eukprot:PhF_6_TR29908/c0_g1_i1/m.43851/K12626/LSM7; U6 snRNA-associated Sm-like protein LSm7
MAIPRKRATLQDLEAFIDQRVLVQFVGGREVEGTLRGVDANMNLLLKDGVEVVDLMANPNVQFLVKGATTQSEGMKERALGAIFCKGSSIHVVIPKNGMKLNSGEMGLMVSELQN